MAVCVATRLAGKSDGLGRDRVLLCHDRDFSALCHDKNLVLRQGLGLGQTWVATRVSLCRDRVFPRVGHSCCNRRFYVATRFSKGGVATGCFSVSIYKVGLRAHDKPRHAHLWRCCACDKVARVHNVATMRTVRARQCARPARVIGATKLSSSTLHCVVHCLSYCSLAPFMDIVHMGFTNLVFDPMGSKKKKNDPQKFGVSQVL